MNWHKLSRKILLAGIPVLLAVWVIACSYRTRYSIGSATGLRGVAVRGGSVEFFSEPWNDPGVRVDSWSEFMRLPTGFRQPWGNWACTDTPVRRRADHSRIPSVAGMGHPPVVEVERRKFLQIPVWALLLPFAGCVVGFCRILERRLESREGKKLAENGAAGHAFSMGSPSAVPTPGGDDDGMSAPDASEPEDAPPEKRGSPADMPLLLAGILLLMTGFVASMAGDFWPLYGLGAAFAFWGLLEADTPLRRVGGVVLSTVCLSSALMDLMVKLAGR